MLTLSIPVFAGSDRPSKRPRIASENSQSSSLSNSSTSLNGLLTNDTEHLARLQFHHSEDSFHKAASNSQPTYPVSRQTKAEQEDAAISKVITGLKNLLNINEPFPEDSNQANPKQARFKAVHDLATQLDKTARQAEADMENGTSKRGGPSILDKPLNLTETSRRYLESVCILEPGGKISDIARYIAERSIEEPEEKENKETHEKELVIRINPPFTNIPKLDRSSYRNIDENVPLTKTELERDFFGYNPYSTAAGIEQLLDVGHLHPLEIKALEDLRDHLSKPSALGKTSKAYLTATGLIEKKGTIPKSVKTTFEALQGDQKSILGIYKALQDFASNWAKPDRIEPNNQQLLIALGFLKRKQITVPESVKTALSNGCIDSRIEHTCQSLNIIEPDLELLNTALQELKGHLSNPSEISQPSLNLLIKLHCLEQKVSLTRATQQVDPEKLRHKAAKDLLNHLNQGSPISLVSLDYLLYAGIFALNRKAELFKATRNKDGIFTFPTPTPEMLNQRLLRDKDDNLVIPKATRATILNTLSIDSNNTNKLIYEYPEEPRKSKRIC